MADYVKEVHTKDEELCRLRSLLGECIALLLVSEDRESESVKDLIRRIDLLV